MRDKTALTKQPETGTCCFKAKSTGNGHQAPEYIYNLIEQYSKPVYEEKFKTKKLYKTHPPPLTDAVPKASHKTMGLPGNFCSNNKNGPIQKRQFTLKHSIKPYVDQNCVKKQVKEAVKGFEKLKLEHPEGRIKDACCVGVKPRLPVTQKYSLPVECNEIPNRTNWIERNAICAITEKPGKRVAHPEKRIVVDRSKGDRQAFASNKTHSGLEKRFVYKPNYGKVPKYLQQRKEVILTTREAYSHYLNEKALQNTDYMLTEEERDDLLKGLKNAWESYNAKYLGLTSTEKQPAYKQYLEGQLKALESDIKMIESHQYIFVEADKSQGVGAAAIANEIHV